MPSLKEIKGRIGSVRSTLKITSAMKLVASAKLRKAQSAIEAMRPYAECLSGILARLSADPAVGPGLYGSEAPALRDVVILAVASNSSLCGGFNAAALRELISAVQAYEASGVRVRILPVGRKMAESVRKMGYPVDADRASLSDRPAYEPAAALMEELIADFAEGRIQRVDLVYNHFVSTASQQPVRETLLPIRDFRQTGGTAEESMEYIVEPSPAQTYAALLPKVLKLRFFAALLDSAAAEHAARTVAMQTATDNGEELLEELSLEYNKGRQQKITSEILDIVGGTLR